MSKLRTYCGPFFVFAGAMHFVAPKAYKAIMPPYIPAHDAMVAASGVTETAGGLGLMTPATRRAGGALLILTLLGVYPANIHMALHPEQFKVPEKALLARLPMQGVFLAWVIAAMHADAAADSSAAAA